MLNPDQHDCTQIIIGGQDLWKCLTCGAIVSSDTQTHQAFHASLARTVGIMVERCAECNGGIRVVVTNGGVGAVRSAARDGRYLAERVTALADVPERGHLVSCSHWKEA